MTSTTIETMEGYAAILDEASQRSNQAALVMHEIAHGGPETDVLTESGLVPSHAKQAKTYLESIPNAVAELSGQMANGRIFDTFAEGRSKSDVGQYFFVTPAGSGLLRVAAFKKISETDQAYAFSYAEGAEVDALNGIIRADAAAQSYVNILDDEDVLLGEITPAGFSVDGLSLRQDETGTGLYDEDDAVILHSSPERVLLGNLEIRPSAYPGIAVVDEEDVLLNDLSAPDSPQNQSSDPFANGLLFEPVIATAANGGAKIYTQGLLTRRELAPSVVASLSSAINEVSETSPVLSVDASRFGSTATLNLRPVDQPDNRRLMTLTLKDVPAQNPPITKKVLAIGDSIMNYSGPLLLEQYAGQLGLSIQWIGTLKSSVSVELNADGPLAEGRSGWETGDFTFAVTDRAYIVEPGAEAAYMAMDKAAKVRYNPFLRVATSGDDPTLVRNGYIFDCAYYQARFGLETPDLVIQALGTNDTRDRSSDSIYNAAYENDLIIYRQIKAAWPNAKIIRTLPGTSTTTDRNALWTSHYVPLIRAMQAARATFNSQKVCLAPLWAMTATDSGYFVTAGRPIGPDGFRVGSWDDPVHLYDATRRGYYKTLAPFVLASILNII